MARHNIDIAIRARDEASATINQMGGLFRGGLGLVAVERAAAGVARYMQLVGLNSAQSAAIVRGDAQGILEKQLEINEAWKDTLRLIPGARPLVEAFFDAFAGEKAIKQTIEDIKNMAKATEEARAAAVKYGNAAEVAQAKALGAGPEEIRAIQSRQEAETGQAVIEKHRAELAKAEARLKETQDLLQRAIRGRRNEPAEATYLRAALGWWGVMQDPIAKLMGQEKAYLNEVREGREALAKEEAELAHKGVAERDAAALEAAQGRAKEMKDESDRQRDDRTQKERDEKAAADAAVRAEEAKWNAIHAAQDRAFNATHDARERELREIDRYYIEQWEKFKNDADVKAALQDAYHEERAATLKKFADEDAEVQSRAAEQARSEAERQARAEFGGGWRAPPTLVSGSLTGLGPEQQAISEARRAGNVLERIEELLKKADRRDSASKQSDAVLTVQIEGG